METNKQTPRVQDLEQLPIEVLENWAMVAELAICKPYFLDRIKTAIFLKQNLGVV